MKHTERVLAVAGAFGAAVMGVALFLPWHVFRVVHWEGAFCFAPDCHAEVYTESALTVCTGYSHLGLAAPLLLAVIVALEVLVASRVTMRRRWIVAIVLLALAVLTVFVDVAGTFLVHMFDSVDVRPAESVFSGTALLVVSVAVAQVVLASVAARVARRAEKAALIAAGILGRSPEARREAARRFFDGAGRVIALCGLASGLVLAATLPLPWHRVPNVFPECAYGGARDGCPTDLAAAPRKECTGLDHIGILALVAIGAILATEGFLAARARVRRRWIGAIVFGAFAAALVLLHLDEAYTHATFLEEPLRAQVVYEQAETVLVALASLQLVVAVVGAAYLRRRGAGPVTCRLNA